MNNKIDDVLFSLIQAKENIIHNSKVNINDNTYKDLVSGLDNLITDYTINNKMSNKEILDCALSLYGTNNKTFLDKLKNLRPKKVIKNLKTKLNDYHKKKELKNQYEDEIVLMVREKLKTMVENDRKTKDQSKPSQDDITKDKSIKSDVKIVNNGIINTNEKELDHHSIEDEQVSKVPIYNKDIVSLIDTTKSGTFIYKDNDNYVVYRESDNKIRDIGITSSVEFPTLNQAVVYAIDDKLSISDVNNNFDKYKDNYGNLANYVTDKRGIDTYNNINIVNINKELKSKNL